jgi:HEPN domain-containing protein
MELHIQFLWLALQAIEKYLKAVLIYNKRTDGKNLGHATFKLYEKLANITDIRFDIPSHVGDFCKFLEIFGTNRYFEHAYTLDGYEIMRLDEAVWFIRRYCQVLRWREETGDTSVPSFAEALAKLQDQQTLKYPARFSIPGGFIEKVRADKKHPARSSLLFYNDYFGRKRELKTVTWNGSWPQINHTPEIFVELEKYVQFSKKVSDHYRTLLKLPPKK